MTNMTKNTNTIGKNMLICHQQKILTICILDQMNWALITGNILKIKTNAVRRVWIVLSNYLNTQIK